nr:hypothetical protein [uncultured Noviherbaspirillum sp.]
MKRYVVATLLLFSASFAVQAQANYYPQAPAPTAALVAECKTDAPSLGPVNLQLRLEACKTNPVYVMCFMEGIGRTSEQISPVFAERVMEKCRRQVGYRPGEYEEEQKIKRQAIREEQNAYNAAKPEREAQNKRELEQIKEQREQTMREGLAERDKAIARDKARQEENRPKEEAYQLNKRAMEIVSAQEDGFDKYHQLLERCTQQTTQMLMQQQRLGPEQRQPVQNRAMEECRRLINTDIVQRTQRR